MPNCSSIFFSFSTTTLDVSFNFELNVMWNTKLQRKITFMVIVHDRYCYSWTEICTHLRGDARSSIYDGTRMDDVTVQTCEVLA
jgi:hypothetical protein